jgi:hypothetical protein
MTGVGLGVVVLIASAFALGWWAAKSEERQRARAQRHSVHAQIERDLRRTLLVCDATFLMWRLEGGLRSPAARRSAVACVGHVHRVIAVLDCAGTLGVHNGDAAIHRSRCVTALRVVAEHLQREALTATASMPPAEAEAAREAARRASDQILGEPTGTRPDLARGP